MNVAFLLEQAQRKVEALNLRIAELEAQVKVGDDMISALLTRAEGGETPLPWPLTREERRLLHALAETGVAGVPKDKARALTAPYGDYEADHLAYRLSALRKKIAPDGVAIRMRQHLGFVIAEGLDKVRAAFGMEEIADGE